MDAALGMGVSAHSKHLYNLYVYFWRWATWKVFGSGYAASTGEDDDDRKGVVCFITVAGFLNGPGFEKMREDLRRECSQIWVIDCSPEGHQPGVATRIFQGVQQPVCIVLGARPSDNDSDIPGEVQFWALSEGRREDKFAELTGLSLSSADWVAASKGWRDSFFPKSTGAWGTFPALEDLFIYNGYGVMPGRTWVIAPDASSLEERWIRLTQETNAMKQEVLFHPHQNGDRTTAKITRSGLSGHEFRAMSVANDNGQAVKPLHYAFRSFDRQWIIPDNRLINRPNPTIWSRHSDKQVYLTALKAHSPASGPAASFCSLVPDMDHYHGRGGRAFPLWQDETASRPNIKPALIDYLKSKYGDAVSAEDILAYTAAILSHPDFTERFSKDLKQPGLRVPITEDALLFIQAASLGREVIWLHCYGERMIDPASGRSKGPPRLPKEEAPTIPASGTIPGTPEPLPDIMEYDGAKNRVLIGKGYVDNVAREVWNYEVSGKNVLRQWFSYRKFDRSRPIIGDRRPPSPLNQIQPEHWLPEYTTDLLNLINVLGRLVKLEAAQKDLLDRICTGPLINADMLAQAGALTGPPKIKGSKKSTSSNQPKLL